MAAYSCSTCDIDYPAWQQYNVCSRCGGKCAYDTKVDKDADWKDRAAVPMNTPLSSPEEDKVVAWRVRELVRSGLDFVDACRLAEQRKLDGSGGFEVDLHAFRKLVDRGASPAQAAQVLG